MDYQCLNLSSIETWVDISSRCRQSSEVEFRAFPDCKCQGAPACIAGAVETQLRVKPRISIKNIEHR